MARSRLTPERESELYNAVLDLLREVGYDALTMDAIATRTRSSKATLYRQWGSKPELVARAMRCAKPHQVGQVDTGSLRGDFLAIAALAEEHKMEEDAALMRALFYAVHNNPDLLQALREVLIEPEIEAFRAMLQRAVDRGDIAQDNLAVPYLIHMLVGAFVARQLIEGLPPDPAFLRSYLDSVVFPALGI
ncbi:TetR/AcrR family transcriptional regulator [Streptomyces sp. NPDC101062]|uniref:TetR/AcrR family transcriptional regulator n=1 Tax=unclassified Streptomyces TaxID=2593676 RepID=UPI002E75A4B0|nr:TetR/AcrR family transcriptional regulator [Streptomyces sp. JV176]MEE1797433.1 TetR/AcrR family transcriptional regulator [Streptomyces sp. JV176]